MMAHPSSSQGTLSALAPDGGTDGADDDGVELGVPDADGGDDDGVELGVPDAGALDGVPVTGDVEGTAVGPVVAGCVDGAAVTGTEVVGPAVGPEDVGACDGSAVLGATVAASAQHRIVAVSRWSSKQRVLSWFTSSDGSV